ncbi:hypothetical protein M501DRAFT_994955 [Patellaria atrata CBS 101060]|uniref:Zn(2)-C6 fungal-type domain-containing protein n=1 Tax=Patellaria atrata CBS 101060 TaxID=1346257 RepID=A0A9P4VRN9_9PEZI|nr:hypothetical protein M501DRAFT_994955 [Patellaria atrata CBS 101060]
MAEGTGSGENSPAPRPLLACYTCKRRKIKCDHGRPACSLCVKTEQVCEYPLTSAKPGPKIGAPQKRKQRRLLDGSAKPTDHTQSPPEYPLKKPPLSSIGSVVPQQDQTVQPLAQIYASGTSSTTGVPEINRSPLKNVTVSSFERAISDERVLSQIMHPSHDPVEEHEKDSLDSSSTERMDSADPGTVVTGMLIEACRTFRMNLGKVQLMIDRYFENMTSFSLFRRPAFDTKLQGIKTQRHAEALLAAMFSFSARFCSDAELRRTGDETMPATEYFHKLAKIMLDSCLDSFVEDTPPLCLLQALILLTFQQLIDGVRGRAWRSLGTCVRIAHEHSLHLIDLERSKKSGVDLDVSQWILDEERRRAWWVIWEFDVFASTVRKLPTAIDWAQNNTWLPVDDEAWYAGIYRPSCVLAIDPAIRWKQLESSGNQSAKAWFIVVNSLMRSAQLVSYPQFFSHSSRIMLDLESQRPSAEGITLLPELTDTAQMDLDILANSLCCVIIALPPGLAFRGEALNFAYYQTAPVLPNSYQQAFDTYSLHIMIQLTRFMIYHNHVSRLSCNNTSVSTPGSSQSLGTSPTINSAPPKTISPSARAAWNHYLTAASEIVSLLRSSPPSHVQHVNPFLGSTIWLTAATQVVYRFFDPPAHQRRAIDSNLDLLRLTFNRYVAFWNISKALQENLEGVERKLERLRRHEQKVQTEQKKDEQVPLGIDGMMYGTGTTNWTPGMAWNLNSSIFELPDPAGNAMDYLGFDMDELFSYN